MTCREVDTILDDYVDDRLPTRVGREAALHLAHCPPCRQGLLGYVDVIDLARAALDEAPPLPYALERRLVGTLQAAAH